MFSNKERKDEKKRKALFGGTFNPIHYGHLRIAEEVREVLNLDKIIFLLSFSPPLKKEFVASADIRLQMLRLAIKDNPFFEVSDIEYRKGGKSYTVETLKILKQIEPNVEFLFILGIDSFLEIPLWKKPEELLRLCDFVVVNRPPLNFEDLKNSPYIERIDTEEIFSDYLSIQLKSGRNLYYIPTTPIGISASDIRKRLKENKSIKYLLPMDVEFFIMKEKIYI